MDAVYSLALATAAFVGTHFLLSHPFRRTFAGRLGERGFTLLYSLIAFAMLGWMIAAWRAAGASYPLWIAPAWWWHGGALVLLFASILLIGSFRRNPSFPHPGSEAERIPPPKGVFAITRHPMNWAFILWALVHISLWGSERNLIVAGGILILALFGSVGQDRRKAASLGDNWREWQARTAFLPFAAQFSGRLSWRLALPGWFAFLGGLIFWLIVTWWHAPNVSPIAYYQDFAWIWRS